MRARAAYDLLVTRGRDGWHAVEVVEISSGEVVLFWDCPARDARRFERALREDLGRMDADEFLDRYTAVRDPSAPDG